MTATLSRLSRQPWVWSFGGAILIWLATIT